MPAVLVLAIFMGVQVFNGMLSLVDPAYGGSVGWWAHVGGFLCGAALAALAPRRRAVRAGRSYGDLLQLLATAPAQRLLGVAGAPQTPRWYAFDRPWERRVYVLWDLGDSLSLSFVVQDGTVRADPATRLVFATAARWQTGP